MFPVPHTKSLVCLPSLTLSLWMLPICILLRFIVLTCDMRIQHNCLWNLNFSCSWRSITVIHCHWSHLLLLFVWPLCVHSFINSVLSPPSLCLVSHLFLCFFSVNLLFVSVSPSVLCSISAFHFVSSIKHHIDHLIFPQHSLWFSDLCSFWHFPLVTHLISGFIFFPAASLLPFSDVFSFLYSFLHLCPISFFHPWEITPVFYLITYCSFYRLSQVIGPDRAIVPGWSSQRSR